MTPEQHAILAALNGDDTPVTSVPDPRATKWNVLPIDLRKWMLDPCSQALFETLSARQRGDLSEQELKERTAARRARVAMYADIKREKHSAR